MTPSSRARTVCRSAALALVGLVASVGLLQADRDAQQSTPRKAPMLLSSMAGRDLYMFYCASCHGREGGGDGPTATALKTAPSDLTTLSATQWRRVPTPAG